MFTQHSFPASRAALRCCQTTQVVNAGWHPNSLTPTSAAVAAWVTAAATRNDSSSTRSFSSSRGERDSRGSRDSYGRGGRGSSSEYRGDHDSYGRGGRGSRDSRGRGGRGSGRGGRSWGSDSRQQHWQEQAPRQQSRYSQQVDDEYSWQGDDDGDDYDGGFQYPARPSKSSMMEMLEGDALYGVAPVLAALAAGIRRPYALLMQEGLSTSARKDARAVSEIQRLATAAGAELKTMSKHDLNMLSGNRPHQGLILDASPLIWREMEQLPHVDDLPQQSEAISLPIAGAEAKEGADAGRDSSSSSSSQRGLQHPVWLALDEVMDPQNLGAMLRSAYCLGVSGVLACSRNCAPLSPVVSKASAGAMELMTLHSCKSMPRTLGAAVNSGWAVVGAAAEANAVPLSEFKTDRPTVLVMGNEGYGVRPIVKRLCTQLVQIEMSPSDAAAAGSGSVAGQRQRLQLVDSLNVSVATGILLHHMLASAKQE